MIILITACAVAASSVGVLPAKVGKGSPVVCWEICQLQV